LSSSNSAGAGRFGAGAGHEALRSGLLSGNRPEPAAEMLAVTGKHVRTRDLRRTPLDEVRLKGRMADVWNRCGWNFTFSAGLLLALSLSGCKDPSQQSPSKQQAGSRQANAADSVQRASAAREYGEDARSGRRRSRRGRADQQAAPGAFDFYLLNLSWSPEFCSTHADSPECGHGLGFVVHGMWPQDVSGDYLEDCSDTPGPGNPQAYTDMIPTAGLVQHEWQTHGTCSGVAADAYFAAVRRAYAAVRIPDGIGAASDASGSVAPDELLARFAKANPSYPQGSIALSCGNNRLTAIEVCLTKDLQPETCQGVRSCRASVIRVTAR
jgi:ribonuclease T2